jgi:hypothetical protein
METQDRAFTARADNPFARLWGVLNKSETSSVAYLFGLSEWSELDELLDKEFFSDDPLLPWGRVKWLQMAKLPPTCQAVAWTVAIFASDQEWEVTKPLLHQYQEESYTVTDYENGVQNHTALVYSGEIRDKLDKWFKLLTKEFSKVQNTWKRIESLNAQINTWNKATKEMRSSKDQHFSREQAQKYPYRYHGDSFLITLLWKDAGFTEQALKDILNIPYNIFMVAFQWHLEAVSSNG